MKRSQFLRTGVASAAALLCAHSAHATSYDLGDDWTANWSSSLSLSSSWRARNADSRLYSQADGILVGKTDGRAPNTVDEGDLNYNKGDRYSTEFKLFSEVEVKKQDFGIFVRAKAWYDEALENENVHLGSQSNGYNHYDPTTDTLGGERPLSDAGFQELNKFKGIYLLDAYVYDTFQIGDQPLQVRAGNQVVNWGESLFVQGINQINPIDVPSFRKPGAQLKEVFLPVPILDLSQSMGKYGSIEGFWQAKWEDTPIEAGCGNYWAVAVGNIGSKPGPCNSAITLAKSQAFGDSVGAYIPTIAGHNGKNSGEYGLAYRFSSDALDTEFGVYAMNLNSRLPVISVQRGGGATASPFSVLWEYPNDIHTFGVSASTNLMGWSVSGEVSRQQNVPIQVDGNDLLFSSLAAGGALAGDGIPAGTPFGPYGPEAAAAFASTSGYLQGYGRANKNQVQLNTVKAGNGILGAGQYLFIAEIAFENANVPDYKSNPAAVRYGRPFVFGVGSNAAYGGSTCGTLNISTAGCQDDGYYSRNAWGYRVKGELTYNDLIPGFTVYPGLYFSHDVSGYSIDSQFSQGRMALTPSVRLSYAKRYTFEIGAVFYNANAKYDPLRDRDSYYATASVSF